MQIDRNLGREHRYVQILEISAMNIEKRIKKMGDTSTEMIIFCSSTLFSMLLTNLSVAKWI
jgi:hypothetical protein